MAQAPAQAAARNRGIGFSYQVPNRLLLERLPEVDLEAPSTATQPGGAPLPSWLTYQSTTRTFTARRPPAGALPYRVQLNLFDRSGRPIQMQIDIAEP
ncbi:MAG: hypothetical protein VKJ66_11305 [Synechococcus sp.]|nr:hypothetical protein [Synechococcus sp.]